MDQYVSLSRAARLVGVSRGILQKRVRAGDLTTFEGKVRLEDLQDLYPDARMEDDSMLERADRIMDNARFKALTQPVLPAPDILAARITLLTEDLVKARVELDQYATLVRSLKEKFDELQRQGHVDPDSPMASLKAWFLDKLAKQRHEPVVPQLLAKHAFLRVMAAQVHILPSRHEYFLQGTDSVLQAGLNAGYNLGYGCNDGSCGRCKAKLLSGRVQETRDCTYDIDPDQRAQGWFLMCCNTAVTDLIIAAEEAHSPSDIGRQQVSMRVKQVEPRNGAVVLKLRMPKTTRFRFLAGQQARVRIGGKLSLDLPIASCPCDEARLEFHIPVPADPTARSALLDALNTTDMVSVEGPSGDFLMEDESTRPLVFVAYGVGFAPIKSLIEHAMALDVAESISLYWIVGGEGGHYADNICRAWHDALDDFSYTPIVSATHETESPEAHETDAITKRILEERTNWADANVYVAGPQTLITSMKQALAARGLPDSRWHSTSLAESGQLRPQA